MLRQWVGFFVAAYHLDDRGRESVFRLAGDLAEAKMGAVDYRRVMGVTHKMVKSPATGER